MVPMFAAPLGGLDVGGLRWPILTAGAASLLASFPVNRWLDMRLAERLVREFPAGTQPLRGDGAWVSCAVLRGSRPDTKIPVVGHRFYQDHRVCFSFANHDYARQFATTNAASD
jgi:hypothetical protein